MDNKVILTYFLGDNPEQDLRINIEVRVSNNDFYKDPEKVLDSILSDIKHEFFEEMAKRNNF